MTKASIELQDLRRRLYVKAKAEPSWRFWGLYVHVCKRETLREAYDMAKQNDGAPGIDGVTFEAIEAQGVDALLEQLRDELTGRTYQPLPARKHEIPKDGGKVRVLSEDQAVLDLEVCDGAGRQSHSDPVVRLVHGRNYAVQHFLRRRVLSGRSHARGDCDGCFLLGAGRRGKGRGRQQSDRQG